MATINEFGITVGDISGKVHNLTLSDKSSPTSAQVEEMISFASAVIASEAEAAGIGVSGLDPTSSTYFLLKSAVINKVVADVLVGRNRGDAAAGEYYLQNWQAAIDTLRRFPQRIQVDSESGPDLAEYVDQSATELKNIEWYGTIPGKLFQGGL